MIFSVTIVSMVLLRRLSRNSQKRSKLEHITHSKDSTCSPGEERDSSYIDVALTNNKSDCRHIRWYAVNSTQKRDKIESPNIYQFFQ